jgi:hypothetical protein
MIRIAMWSGPRNVSTAMMRAWGNRPDSFVCDEPFYGHYLAVTHKLHPGADEIIATEETDWRRAVARLTEFDPPGKSIFYQKHMAHHLLPDIGRDWLVKLTNCFLIRNPADVITSYIAKHDYPTAEDLGFIQQVEMFDYLRDRGRGIPPVVDAADVQNSPRQTLGALCDAVGVQFQENMLSWPPGTRTTDGVWAKYWYKEVEGSTGFRPYKTKPEPVPAELKEVHARCQAAYEKLYEYRLR